MGRSAQSDIVRQLLDTSFLLSAYTRFPAIRQTSIKILHRRNSQLCSTVTNYDPLQPNTRV